MIGEGILREHVHIHANPTLRQLLPKVIVVGD